MNDLASGLTPQASGTAARLLLAGHIALIAFATFAMVTFLAGDFPAWMQGPYTARVYEVSWRYTGQVYVVLGLLAAAFHAAPRFGWGRTLATFATAIAVALGSELIGTNFGVPFGAYHYTAMLGYRVNGDVPYVIPLSWCYMLYCCLAMCGRVLSHVDSPAARWRWALLAGAMLTAWDVPLEVHMTNVPPVHWIWDIAAMPAWLPDLLTRGAFYGMPLTNWVGWLLTATVIARLMLAVVPPSAWATQVSPAFFPLTLYAANGIMPIATVARHGLWGAAIAGAVAMGAVLLAAGLAGPAASEQPGGEKPRAET